MPVIRVILLIIVAGIGFSFSSGASAEPYCWTNGGTNFAFGTVTAGQSASTSAQVPLSCQNYTSAPTYIRACLTLQDNAPLSMHLNPDNGYLLYFNLYPTTDPDSPLSASSTVYAQQDLVLASEQQSGLNIPLIAKIIAGQSKLSAGDYYNYTFTTITKYSYASSASQLPSCASMPATNVYQASSGASAVIKNGCQINNVSDLNFGEQSPAASSTLSTASTSTITVTCPVNTSFSVGLGSGLHSQQSTRYLCNSSDNQCVSYKLYQDAAHSKVWDNTNTQTFSSATGSSQSMTVYGVVPSQSWPTPGNYSDTVTVTLNY